MKVTGVEDQQVGTLAVDKKGVVRLEVTKVAAIQARKDERVVVTMEVNWVVDEEKVAV